MSAARPHSEDPVWMYVDKWQRQRGPVSECELKFLIASKAVDTTTYGWREGMENWALLAQTPIAMEAFLEVGENEEGWFYMHSDENIKRGPFDEVLLKQLISSGQVGRKTLMWRAGSIGEWRVTLDVRSG